jgi:hypothetical protein
MGFKKKLSKLLLSTGSVWRKYISIIKFWGEKPKKPTFGVHVLKIQFSRGRLGVRVMV